MPTLTFDTAWTHAEARRPSRRWSRLAIGVAAMAVLGFAAWNMLPQPLNSDDVSRSAVPTDPFERFMAVRATFPTVEPAAVARDSEEASALYASNDDGMATLRQTYEEVIQEVTPAQERTVRLEMATAHQEMAEFLVTLSWPDSLREGQGRLYDDGMGRAGLKEYEKAASVLEQGRLAAEARGDAESAKFYAAAAVKISASVRDFEKATAAAPDRAAAKHAEVLQLRDELAGLVESCPLPDEMVAALQTQLTAPLPDPSDSWGVLAEHQSFTLLVTEFKTICRTRVPEGDDGQETD